MPDSKPARKVDMRTYDECIPCIEKQIRRMSKNLTDDPDLQKKIVDGCREVLDSTDMNQPPPYFGQKIHRAIRELSGNPDPYKEEKDLYNRRALALYPQLKSRVQSAPDPFRMAVMIALAGNIIDFGVSDDIRLEETIDRVIGEKPAVDQVALLKEKIAQAQTILYLGDNAGETVMDRILIEQFEPGKQVTYAVRGAPILNDATIEDALVAKLDQVAAIMPNGSNAPGTILDDCTQEFMQTFRQADLIIAKGMGNYESLSENAGREIFFILLIKCDLVARHIGSPVGKAVVTRM